MRILPYMTVVLVLAAACAAPAWAAEGGSGDLVNPKVGAIISAIVIFVLLLVVLGKFAWKPILAGLKTREQTIQRALDEAKEASEEAQRLIKDYEARIDEARNEAAAIADEARSDAEDIKARIMEEAKAEADASVKRASREIEQMTDKAWEHLVAQAANLASEAASRIVGKTLDTGRHAEIVSEVVSEFSAKAKASGGTETA